MESVIISSEIVRPSSPTPQTYKFSMLDQLSPNSLNTCIFFFPYTLQITDLHSFISETTQKLQRSLSLVLSRYYPLAGRLSSDGESIDCNDGGVPFIVAKIKGQLSDLSGNSYQKPLDFLLPCEISYDKEYGPDSPITLIKANYFDCGGMAIGFASNHKVMDAVSFATFFNSWAGVARAGPTEPVCPNFIFSSLFPPVLGLCMTNQSMQKLLKTGCPVMRHYVFDASAISSLKSGSKGATRIEAVTALIWKCFMAASLANNRSVSAVTHSVNMRRRTRPAFPSDCFGNFVRLAVAATGNDEDNDLAVLAGKVREAINKIDDDFVNRMRGEDGLSGERENSKLVWGPTIQRQPDFLHMASWCSFDLYGIDFGWGKPGMVVRCDVWTAPNSKFMNTVWMMDSRSGDNGIEVWVVLDEKYMAVFENVEELRGFASHVDKM